jgi:hypothetical protein
VNTQQNYWAAEPINLAECQEPLIRLDEGLSRSGRATAASMYGAPGWVAHTVTNAWGYSAAGVAGAEASIYSFDGNAGGSAGVAEMLLQSDVSELELLHLRSTKNRELKG